MRDQSRTDKKSFVSPTTPGLYVDFRNYIIELVCLNMQPKLGPRFWRDTKYWGPKYRREIKGVFNLSKELDFGDPIVRTALVEVVKQCNIKATVAKKTVTRIVRITRLKQQEIIDCRQYIMKKQPPTIVDPENYNQYNARLIDTNAKSKLAKLKKLENGKKTKENRTD